jgi:hypothetical protein
MPRPMTPDEKREYRAIFPRLDVDRAIVTGEASAVYNCIAFTVGVTNAWLWPGDTMQHFDSFYAQYGFIRSSSGHIAAWGSALNAMTHGSIAAPPPLALWESKCGQGLRFQHRINELESSAYGRILAFYAKGRALPFADADLRAANEGSLIMPLAPEEQEQLRSLAAAMPNELKQAFNIAFERWRKDWNLPQIALSSNPAARKLAPSFYALVALGPNILPLVVQRMAEPENFFVLMLYEQLQGDPTLRIMAEPSAPEFLEGEQGRAIRTVRRYLSDR